MGFGWRCGRVSGSDHGGGNLLCVKIGGDPGRHHRPAGPICGESTPGNRAGTLARFADLPQILSRSVFRGRLQEADRSASASQPHIESDSGESDLRKPELYQPEKAVAVFNTFRWAGSRTE